jgi:hypothetical protein
VTQPDPQLLVQTVQAIVAEALASMPRGVGAFQAQVTAINGTWATVTWQGQKITAPCLSPYTPVIDHQVLVLLANTDPIILGRIPARPGS